MGCEGEGGRIQGTPRWRGAESPRGLIRDGPPSLPPTLISESTPRPWGAGCLPHPGFLGGPEHPLQSRAGDKVRAHLGPQAARTPALLPQQPPGLVSTPVWGRPLPAAVLARVRQAGGRPSHCCLSSLRTASRAAQPLPSSFLLRFLQHGGSTGQGLDAQRACLGPLPFSEQLGHQSQAKVSFQGPWQRKET